MTGVASTMPERRIQWLLQEQDVIVIELASRLNRCRSLDDQESRWLEEAVRREQRRDGFNGKQRWLAHQDRQLIRKLRQGRNVRDIARSMLRSESAIWSRIRQLRRTGRLSAPQSPMAQPAMIER